MRLLNITSFLMHFDKIQKNIHSKLQYKTRHDHILDQKKNQINYRT